MASTKSFVFISIMLTVSYWHMVQCQKRTVCPFNEGCWCYGEQDNLTAATCSDFSTFPTFTKMPNGTSYLLPKLSIGGNFTKIPSYAFDSVRPDAVEFLREGDVTLPLYVDTYAYLLSSNKSTQIHEMKFVNFKGLTALPTAALSQMISLSTLCFINSTFTTIDEQAFDGVLVSNLFLIGCGIKTISDDAFSQTLFYDLELSYNQLTEVPEAVTTVPLRKLSLDNNQITNIRDNAFCSKSSNTNCQLTELNLYNNPIGDNFADDAFANLKQLNVLYMPNIGMTKIPTRAIQPLANSLSSFDVSYNKIKAVLNETFNGFTSLSQHLVLDFNPIELIEPGAFDGMKEVVLAIRNLPKLKTIDAAVTHGVKGIGTLYVADCPELIELTMHDLNLLDVLLSKLDFSNSDDLQVVDSNVGKWLKQSSYNTLDISNNKHFRCDNSTDWMAEFSVCKNPQIKVQNTTCVTTGTSLFDYLSATNYKCPGENGSVRISISGFAIFLIIATRLVTWL